MPETDSQNIAKPSHTHTSCGTSPVSACVVSADACFGVAFATTPLPGNATNANASTASDASHTQ